MKLDLGESDLTGLDLVDNDKILTSKNEIMYIFCNEKHFNLKTERFSLVENGEKTKFCQMTY